MLHELFGVLKQFGEMVHLLFQLLFEFFEGVFGWLFVGVLALVDLGGGLESQILPHSQLINLYTFRL